LQRRHNQYHVLNQHRSSLLSASVPSLFYHPVSPASRAISSACLCS
jgi:hypothetical protein